MLGFPLTQPAQEIFFGFETAADKLSLVTVVAHPVRGAVAAIAVDEAGMRFGKLAKRQESRARAKQGNQRQCKPEAFRRKDFA